MGVHLVSNFYESTCALCQNGKNWFQTGLTHPFRWMSGKSKKVEAAARGPFLFPTYLGRSKGLCSQGSHVKTTNRLMQTYNYQIILKESEVHLSNFALKYFQVQLCKLPMTFYQESNVFHTALAKVASQIPER